MNLRDYLRKHSITQAEFGRLIDPPISQGKVNHWLQGTRRVALHEALQIVRITAGEVDLESLARPVEGAACDEMAGEGA